MSIEISLESMSVSEKIRLLENVWSSLCNKTGDVRSPEWHSKILEDRKQRLDQGKASISPWKEAKARLLEVGK